MCQEASLQERVQYIAVGWLCLSALLTTGLIVGYLIDIQGNIQKSLQQSHVEPVKMTSGWKEALRNMVVFEGLSQLVGYVTNGLLYYGAKTRNRCLLVPFLLLTLSKAILSIVFLCILFISSLAVHISVATFCAIFLVLFEVLLIWSVKTTAAFYRELQGEERQPPQISGLDAELNELDAEIDVARTVAVAIEYSGPATLDIAANESTYGSSRVCSDEPPTYEEAVSTKGVEHTPTTCLV